MDQNSLKSSLTCSKTCHSTCLHRTCSSPPACTAWRTGCPRISRRAHTARSLWCSADQARKFDRVNSNISNLGCRSGLTSVCCCVLLVHWSQDKTRDHLYRSLLKCVDGYANAITLQWKLPLTVKLLKPLNSRRWVTWQRCWHTSSSYISQSVPLILHSIVTSVFGLKMFLSLTMEIEGNMG